MKKTASRFRSLFVGTVVCATLAGCGSTDSHNTVSGEVTTAPGTTTPNRFVVTEVGVPTLNGDVVDSMEIEAFDAQGNRLVFDTVAAQGTNGPVQHVVVPFSETMEFPPLPPGTASVELDYLRNGGYTLFRARESVQPEQTSLDDPSEQPANVSRSQWRLQPKDDGGFALELIKSVAGERETTSQFKIKGICYSPTPINVIGDGAPNIGDFFFDSLVNRDTQNIDFFNWFGLWGSGSLGDGYYAREDLNKMRDLGANTIRVYSMLSRQQNDVVTNPKLTEFPDPTLQTHRTHKQFLDQCWNNGRNPLYVIVGIPMPPDNFYLRFQETSRPKIEFYDFVLKETIGDLKDHPAVLGFTTQNELNDGEDAFPREGGGQMIADNPSSGTQNERSDFYWGKVKEHSDYAKATAPDKLNGAVFHDFREVAQYASNFPQTGGNYLERAKNLDFVGINSYQTVDYKSQFEHGWGAITGPGKKALLFSELGFPATTRDEGDPRTIKDTQESRQATAETIARMLPQAYSDAAAIGACYFEFSDEWWKEKSNTKVIYVGNAPKTVPAADEWYGGQQNLGFPNKWADEEGFGLFSIARYKGLANSDPVMVKVGDNDIGPDRRFDVLTERKEITSVVKRIFNSL